jgi:hypothetical protein
MNQDAEASQNCHTSSGMPINASNVYDQIKTLHGRSRPINQRVSLTGELFLHVPTDERFVTMLA